MSLKTIWRVSRVLPMIYTDLLRRILLYCSRNTLIRINGQHYRVLRKSRVSFVCFFPSICAQSQRVFRIEKNLIVKEANRVLQQYIFVFDSQISISNFNIFVFFTTGLTKWNRRLRAKHDSKRGVRVKFQKNFYSDRLNHGSF